MAAAEKKHLVPMTFSSAHYGIDDAARKSLYVNKRRPLYKIDLMDFDNLCFIPVYCCCCSSISVKFKFQNRKPKQNQIKRKRGSQTEALKRHSGIFNIY